MRVALGIEYAGTRFCGWQLQQGVRTVQACVEEALGRIADHPVRVACAGRTDAGVHALGQVAHFDTTAQRRDRSWVFGANTHLPPDVSVRWARPVADDFHARFSALRRHYRYVIRNTPVRPALPAEAVAWEYRALDAVRMDAAARHLIGRHDFSSYRAYACQAKSPVRTVQRLEVRRHEEFVVIDIVADAFLHHMVRNIAGVLIAIGAGERETDWSREVLEHRDRRLGGVNAVPAGLYFVGVEYPERYDIPYEPARPGVW
ncbi:MAG: tRNA pseudouridine(38-40) synthase TruA [Gammaproteobacteria bacterium]|nr:tRNA pseudouridine(38-40) synthase TruA [Gammaproteobacteria bacterium]